MDFTVEEKVQELTGFGAQEAAVGAWFITYVVVKGTARLMYGGKCWDFVCLIHNIVSVVIGCYAMWNWEEPEHESCHSLNSMGALVITLQFIHSITDFVIFIPEMVSQSIFMWHHGVLAIVSLILPFCPGCYFVTIAYTLAEFGSGAIGVDAEWRKTGGYSRGLKRVVVFGLTRLINIYLLYRIWVVTPSTTYFTLSNENGKIFTVNVPICMITSVGGSIMMLIVNGVTWFRMYFFYVKHKKKRKALARKAEEEIAALRGYYSDSGM